MNMIRSDLTDEVISSVTASPHMGDREDWDERIRSYWAASGERLLT